MKEIGMRTVRDTEKEIRDSVEAYKKWARDEHRKPPAAAAPSRANPLLPQLGENAGDLRNEYITLTERNLKGL